MAYAFVTLLTTDSYLPGALTALHSLLDVEGVHPTNAFDTVCLVTPATVGQDAIQALNKTFDHVVGVSEISTPSWPELALLGRKDLHASLTKLHLFRLTQYAKVIFLDADTLVRRPLSSLFTLDAPLSAAPDSGWPDGFNSGFMVVTPSKESFDGLMGMMAQRGSWDGGDQGLLNDFFPNWNRLSFTYNVTPSEYYTYAPAYKRHGSDVSVLHFIGARKPWHRGTRDTYVPNQAQTDYYGLVNQWFDVFEHHFGTTPAQLVASRVVNPPASFKSTYSDLAPHTPSPPTPSPPSPPPVPVPPPALPPPTPLAAPVPVRPFEAPPTTVWDPARSSPPRRGQHQMVVPITEHYENAWDSSSSAAATPRFEAPSMYPAVPAETHDWYKDVMGGAPPDPKAVKAVFPWESDAPRREFPKPPSPPPALPTPAPPPPPATTFVPVHERVFVNAWDNIPGIGRYAQSLAKVTGGSRKPSQSAPLEGDALGGRTSSLTEPAKSDASSRDGDDEDEDETSSEEAEKYKIVFRKGKDRAGAGSGSSGSSGNSPVGGSAPSSPTKTRKGGPGIASPRLREDLPPSSPVHPHSHPHSHPHHAHGHPHSHVSHSHGKRSTSAAVAPPPSTSSPRFPSATSPRLAAQAARNSAAARLTGTGDGPAPLRATRVFSPDTDTGVVKQQGLAALQRFVENMEAETGGRGVGAAPSPSNGGRGSGGAFR